MMDPPSVSCTGFVLYQQAFNTDTYLDRTVYQYISYLYSSVTTFQECNGEKNALMENSIASGIHDEIYDQVRCPFLIEMTLDICQTHFTTAC